MDDPERVVRRVLRSETPWVLRFCSSSGECHGRVGVTAGKYPVALLSAILASPDEEVADDLPWCGKS